MQGGIDNATHLGGLVSGLLFGYAWYPSLQKPDELRIKRLSIALPALLILAASFFVYKSLPAGMGRYAEGMKEFNKTEIAALSVYRLPADAPKTTILYAMKEDGLNNWNKALHIIDELEQLDIPESLHKRNKILRAYCKLRIQVYELTIRAMEENSGNYQSRIDDYNRQIETITAELRTGDKIPK